MVKIKQVMLCSQTPKKLTLHIKKAYFSSSLRPTWIQLGAEVYHFITSPSIQGFVVYHGKTYVNKAAVASKCFYPKETHSTFNHILTEVWKLLFQTSFKEMCGKRGNWKFQKTLVMSFMVIINMKVAIRFTKLKGNMKQ